MHLLKSGNTEFSPYTGAATEEITRYNARCTEIGLPEWGITIAPPFDDTTQDDVFFKHQTTWLIPLEYQTIDIRELIVTDTMTDIQLNRIDEELELFGTKGLYPVLRALVYIVDMCRENNIVWGVGRGSSVASYVLYLLGVHKVNPLEYDLPISEFLK